MSWEDRLREAAYTAPSGTRQTFDYEDVTRSIEKKTSAFNFPDANGTYVQDSGYTGRQYPLRLFFSGADCDLEADAFEALLLEAGTGRLEHPIYGTVDVVPFGTITRRDDLKTAANQSVLEVTFWATIDVVYPTSEDDPGSAVVQAVDAYNTAAADAYADATDIDTAVERVSLKNNYTALLDSASASLQSLANTQDDVRQQYNTIETSITAGIDTLVADPLTLAFQTVQLVQAPARAATLISDRLTAYRDLALAITSGEGATVTPGNDSRESNLFRVRDLYASTYVTGSIVSAVNTQFTTRRDALQAADDILAQFETVAAWRDNNFTSLGQIDTGEAYQQLQEAVALTAGFLVFISFSLKQEKQIVLDRARTIIDLAAELYGSADDQLDFLIQSNSLSGSEILELPRGRPIVYYV